MRVYWDSGIFIHWMKWTTETGKGEFTDVELAAVEDLIHQQLDGKATILASSIVRSEVFHDYDSAEAIARYNNLRSHRHFVEIASDNRIMDRAGELRRRAQKEANRKLTTPDAIHLATALHYRATRFWTLDRKLQDLPASLREGLVICRPYADQAILPTVATAAAKAKTLKKK